MSNKKRTDELKIHKNNGRKISTTDDARKHVEERQENYRAKHGNSLLCLSLTRGVLLEGNPENRREFHDHVYRHATANDPVYIGTINDFLNTGRVERIMGNNQNNQYGRGKYGGTCV